MTATARRKGSRMVRKTKSSKPTACQLCLGTDLVRRITTYPVHLEGELKGKQIHVGRVALYECQSCGHLMPTAAGQAKVDRNVNMGIRLFLGQLP
jgi:hypothetical protein